MNTLNFEAIKVSLKQDKTGYVLTLCIHPDDIPEDLLRDFVGAHYQVVMVRLNEESQPMDRDKEFERERAVKLAAILCKEESFWEFLNDTGEIFECNENEAATWLRNRLNIKSRSELKTNPEARIQLEQINKEYMKWNQRS